MIRAAFVRVEETLLASFHVEQALYTVLQAPGFSARAWRLGGLALALPVLGVLGRRDRRSQRRLAYYQLRGLTVQRIELLTAELHDRILASGLRSEGLEVVRRAREQGCRVVLFAGGLASALTPLRDLVEADALLGSQMELRGGRATGRLRELAQGRWFEGYAQAEGISLDASYAYGSDGGDVELLRSVGFPCAVNPDRRLREVAERASWPILRSGAA